MTATLTKVLTAYDKQDRAEVQQTLQQVVAEAQQAFPERGKLFASHHVFNNDFQKTFSTVIKLTHQQWYYILDKAITNVGDRLNNAGHVDVEAIFSDCYALTIHQITMMYGMKYGTAQALHQLNRNNRGLFDLSEGGIIASEIVMACIAPEKRMRGYAESLVSCVIRKRYAPAQITAHIKLAATKYIGHQQEQYNLLKSRLNPLAISPLHEDCDLPATASKVLNVYQQLRLEELKEHFSNAVSDLKERVENDKTQGVAKSLDIDALSLLQAWSSDEGMMIVSHRQTFAAQARGLAPSLGISNHRAGIVANYLVELFKNHFAIIYKYRYQPILRFKNSGTRTLREKNNGWQNVRKDAQVETVIHRFVDICSPYLDKNDQSLLNLGLANGIDFL